MKRWRNSLSASSSMAPLLVYGVAILQNDPTLAISFSPSVSRIDVFEMLAERDSLPLIVGLEAGAVKLARRRSEPLVHEPPDDLPVLDHARNFVRAHFEHRARAFAACVRVSETR